MRREYVPILKYDSHQLIAILLTHVRIDIERRFEVYGFLLVFVLVSFKVFLDDSLRKIGYAAHVFCGQRLCIFFQEFTQRLIVLLVCLSEIVQELDRFMRSERGVVVEVNT